MSADETPDIKDIAKFKKMREQMESMKYIKAALPIVSPILGLLGVDTKDMKEAFKDFDKLEKEFKELSETPDLFNDMFSSRGWILYEIMNLDTAKEALNLAHTDIEVAEQFLVNFYTPELVESYLFMMNGVMAFRPRMELAEKALIDYKEGRYHACIPVILALMDGLVNDLQHLGMFSEEADLSAWDCMTAHEKGLNALKKVLFATRKKTRTEQIDVPYRNGIMHGMDLGYANKTVAAKTWAALFSVRDWAIKVEQKELSKPPPKPETTWRELGQQLLENKSFKEQLEQWQPRTIKIGSNIPANGDIEDYPKESPERKLVEFLTYWKQRNYGFMGKCIAKTLSYDEKELPKIVRQAYSERLLESFSIVGINDQVPAATEIEVFLKYSDGNQKIEKNVNFRLIIEKANGEIAMHGMPEAEWGITNWGRV